MATAAEGFQGVAQRFDTVAAEFAGQAALVDAAGTQTYAELQASAARIAAVLADMGLCRGQCCAMLVPRGRDTLALILAIVRLGAIYVPLDPASPRGQLEAMIRDCNPALVIGAAPLLAATGGLAADCADMADILARAAQAAPAPVVAVEADDPVYIMYTSGSTGMPKGVVVPHRAVVRLVQGQSFMRFSPQLRFLNLAPLAFDASTLEIWAPLLNGGCAAIISEVQPSLDIIATRIAELGATAAWFTAGLFNALADYRPDAFAPLSQVLTGGDVLSPVHVQRVMAACPQLEVINGYGPTENTTFTCCYRIERNDDLAQGKAIPIGYPINGTSVFIVNERLEPVADGEAGELVTGGAGVALGYLNRPELTAEKFVTSPLAAGQLLYRTGDQVRRRADGAIAFLGRADRQIKIAGKRVELDGIEHAIKAVPAVADCVVAVLESGASKRIAAFIRGEAGTAAALTEQVRTHLAAALPDYMMPAQFHVLHDFPLTPNGKVNRAALVESLSQHMRNTPPSAPVNDLADRLAVVFEGIAGAPVAHDRNFFDLGLRSLDLMKAHAIVQRELAPAVSLVDLFEHPNITALAAHLGKMTQSGRQTRPASPHAADKGQGAIAIIGMAGRFPGARHVREFWANILAGRDCISHFSSDELEDSFDDRTRQDARYVKARPILEDVDRFDAGFFGMMAREAALTDPQQRIFLQIAWEAFEDAGYDPATVSGPVGVFAGTSMNTYFLKHVLSDRAVIEEFTSQFQVGEYQKLVGAGDFVATRTAYRLDLKGPAVSVQTACSTSLTAIGQAVDSLRCWRCDMALAGGVSISFPQKRGYFYEEGGMGAPDGVCRPFDARAGGTVFGAGAGVVLLKRLDEALADGDPVYAVIRGVGINNDGADKVGFTAPSVEGQAGAIMAAHRDADVDPASIGYIEAHGTATPLGDPIEFAGLVRAFAAGGATGGQFCAIGSAKANVGHLDAAAGVTGLISAALALYHSTLPPLLHFTAPNPNIAPENSPFFMSRQARPWPAGQTPRRAGVSAFGVGGTNVHLVLEEASQPAPVSRQAPGPQLLPLSARSPAALARMKANLADYLEAHPHSDLCDVAYTLQSGRRAFAHRGVIVAANIEEACAKLRQASADAEAHKDPPVIFMFPGQGAQYPGMGKALYDSEPVFRFWIDRAAECLAACSGIDMLPLLFNDSADGEDTPHPIRSTIHAQPALFMVEYALARLWMARGIRPAAMIGHSIGELVAATVAGAISFEDAIHLIARRGALMQAAEPGAMLAVRLSEAGLRPLLTPGVDMAAINAPSLCVVAGPFAAIAAFEALLDSRDIGHRRLHTSHAFHSQMMAGVVDELAGVADRLTFMTPQIPYVSSVTGQWASMEAPVDGRYWAQHCRNTVRFAEALATVTEGQRPILLEVGPGRTLTTFALQGAVKSSCQAMIASLPDFAARADERTIACEATGRLWSNGVALDWTSVRADHARHIHLPTYPFEPERHWIEAPALPDRQQMAVQEVQALQTPPSCTAPSPVSPELQTVRTTTPMPVQIDRKPRLVSELLALLTELSGETPDISDPQVTFWDLGYDSLFMGQVAQQLRRRYDVKITFRQIMGDYPTVPALVQYIDEQLAPDPVETPVAVQAVPVPPAAVAVPPAAAPVSAPAIAAVGDVQSVIRDQLATMQALMERQLDMVRTMQAAPAAGVQAVPPPPATATAPASAAAAGPQIRFDETRPTRFNAYKPGAAAFGQITPAQKAFIAEITRRYGEKTPTSKARTQTYRAVLADPRTASGFREDWKELVYPIVAQQAKGSMIRDLDGNDYIDLVNGYGQTAFGHAPDFVVEAVEAQMREGFAIGPQSPLAGEVAQMFAAMTGHERVTFCNTGSEAVMAAMRLARTVTGRNRIVCFDGDYHGQFDEVLVKPGSKDGVPRALPLAPGIPQSSVSNMVVLAYAQPESLEWIKANINDIAAVLVEPVQSRHPGLRPKEFVQELRAVTQANDCALIFDEVVTGFRVAPAGMQGYWGIKGDMATYGKVVGGGLPVGVLAGSARFMDALDGGQWQFGDASVPEVAPTFFAGTFVRHPLVLAAMKAVLTHLEQAGPALQQQLAARMEGLVGDLNACLEQAGIATRVETFSSWFHVDFSHEDRLGSLFYPYMRLLGVHIMEGFPCFLTTAHSQADIEKIRQAFTASIAALQAVGILAGHSAAAGQGGSATGQEPVENAPGPAPLTEPQKEIWMANQLGEAASLTFNESFTLELEGNLDEALFERAFTMTMARHDALRAHFSRVGDIMSVDPETCIMLDRIDLTQDASPADALAAIVADEARAPFDLTTPPLVRARLVRLAAERRAFIFTAHHIICDGWSANIILRDMQAVYAALTRGAAPDLAPVQSYLAYARAEAMTGTDAATRRFWLDLHRDPAPRTDLPSDRPRPERKTFLGASTTHHIGPALLAGLKKVSSGQGCSLFATLFGAVQVLFGRLAGQDDVVIAAPMAGQANAGSELLVGHCVNFLPLRVAFDRSRPFCEHMKAVRDHLFDASEHQNYTYGALVRDLDIRRSFDRLPLTDLQFNLEKIDGELEVPGISTRFAPNPKAFSNFDLFLNVIESPAGLRLDCDYSTDMYDEATILRWLGHYETLLCAIADAPQTLIADLPLLNRADITWLRDTLNDTMRDYAPHLTASTLIAAQAARSPDAIALACPAEQFTYGELDARADHIARGLIASGIKPGQRIALALGRRAATVAAMIGVWRAGCAYVPLDMNLPQARIGQILAGADSAAILCDQESRMVLEPGTCRVLELESLMMRLTDAASSLPHIHADDTAYIMFTSGSTGEPKGVEIPHSALANFLQSMAHTPGFDAGDMIVAVTTFSFDISALELLLPLTVGGRAFIAGHEEVRTAYELVARLQSEKATTLQATPTLWRMLLEAGFKPGPGFRMLCGGEALPRDLADAMLATGAEVWNLYGPTETTIWSSAGRVQEGQAVSIGAPIANTQLHVLTADMKLAPVGVAGDLWIGGRGLAKGYFNRQPLTEAAFRTIAVEGAPPCRLYRTGDVAMRQADGALHLLGRSDQQIKLRGFRIEIEEIEVSLRQADGVRDAAVALHTVNRDQRLVGYIVSTDTAADFATLSGKLAGQLAARLPSWMVPGQWVQLDALPRTGNGKLDRKALLPPPPVVPTATMQDRPALAGPSAQPLTATQSLIATIWQEVLGQPDIGIHQRFFSLGADSLQLFRIVARLNEKGLAVDARQLMKNVTIAELDASLQSSLSAGNNELPATARPSIAKFSRRTA